MDPLKTWQNDLSLIYTPNTEKMFSFLTFYEDDIVFIAKPKKSSSDRIQAETSSATAERNNETKKLCRRQDHFSCGVSNFTVNRVLHLFF